MNTKNIIKVFVILYQIIFCGLYYNNTYADKNQKAKIESEYWEEINKQSYTKDNLYDYIDGEADIHFTYNFNELNVIDFTLKQNKNILASAEIYSYSNQSDAYGIFSLISRNRKKIICQTTVIYSHSDNNFIFYKGNYFGVVRISGKSGKDKKIHAIELIELGKSVANTIEGTIDLPLLTGYIPDKNIDKSNLVYFHNKKILDQFKYFSRNLFCLDNKTNAIISKCEFDSNTLYLMIEYPNKDTCDTIYKTLVNKGKNIMNNPVIFIQRIEKTYMYVSKEDKFIIAVIKTHNESESIDLIKQTVNALRKSAQ